MNLPRARATALFLAALLLGGAAQAAETAPPPGWQGRHDRLVQRLRGLAPKEGAFGEAYRPLYHAALPWYELWGGRDAGPVDPDMVSPEDYAESLALALEQGRNVFAENPSSLFPLVFQKTLPGGAAASANYWISLPAGFPSAGRTFPLVVDLHGSGWLGHKISFKHIAWAAGRTFGVTPINMAGAWRIDFLNGYLDELLAILPVDADRVYVQGHSLGAMATWEWALDNPERFAAISPRAGVGEPYRARRLRQVPSWVIHGENDDVIPTGFADQMVTALESQGAGVRLSLIVGGEHNMPADLDQRQVVDWYLGQRRSPLPPPDDPRDHLGLNAAGFSPWEVIDLPATPSWTAPSSGAMTEKSYRSAARELFRKVHERGERVDSPLELEMDLDRQVKAFWLAVPRTLHPTGAADASIVVRPGARFVRFYFKGPTEAAFAHLAAVKAEAASAGHALSGGVWYIPMSLWQGSPGAIAEYRIRSN